MSFRRATWGAWTGCRRRWQSTAGTAVQARMPLMPLGVFQADEVLERVLAEVE